MCGVMSSKIFHHSRPRWSLLFISKPPLRPDGPSSKDRTVPVAHYEANIGMTAPALHKGIASTAGGRKPQGLFLGNIPVGLNRRGHAIGHNSCSCIRSWVAEPRWPADGPPQAEWERLGWGLKPTSSRTGDAGQGWLITLPISQEWHNSTGDGGNSMHMRTYRRSRIVLLPSRGVRQLFLDCHLNQSSSSDYPFRTVSFQAQNAHAGLACC